MTKQDKIALGTAICLLLVGWWYTNAKSHQENIQLSEKAKNNFDSLKITLTGRLIFSEISANNKCNWARYKAVYSTDVAPQQNCQSVSDELRQLNNISDQKCHAREEGARGLALPFGYYFLGWEHNIRQHKQVFSALFYPNLMSHPGGQIVGGHDAKIMQFVRESGIGFYKVDYEYREPYDDSFYSCNERECVCAYPTYAKTVLWTGEEFLWER